MLDSNERGIRFEVLSNPEFLAEGITVISRGSSTSDGSRIGSFNSAHIRLNVLSNPELAEGCSDIVDLVVMIILI